MQLGTVKRSPLESHKGNKMKTFRMLIAGDKIEQGDEGYTWADPDCRSKGWVKICPNAWGDVYDPTIMVQIRREVNPTL